MTRQQQRCTYCHEPATLLCDFQLGRPMFDRGPNGTPKPWHTCDLPVCRAHGKQVGMLHVKAGRKGYFDTFDRCLEHVGVSEAVPTPRIVDGEAERLRRAVRERAQRRALENGVRPDPTLPASQGTLF